MSKSESDAAVVPATTPEPGPASGPTLGPTPGPESTAAPWTAPAPAAPLAPPAPATPFAPSVPATPSATADAPAAGPVPPPAADPWAAPADMPPPVDPADPATPQPTGWAAVTPASQSGFQPGFPYPEAPTRTNGFAIASLVTALFCLWPLALGFAVVALVQISRRNEKGRGLAVSGLVVGVLSLIVSLIAFIGLAALGLDEERYGDSRRGPKGSVAVNDLRVGDCFDQPPLSPGGDTESSSVYWVRVVPCTAPHHAEVAGTVVLPGRDDQYPSRKEIGDGAEKLCGPVRDDYALDSWLVPEGVDGYYYYPSVRSWMAGDRRVTCTFQDERQAHTGSVRTDRTKLTQAQRTYLDAVLAYNKALFAEPEQDVDEAPAKYREWAKTMAAACRKEVAELSANGIDWPEGARAKLIELGAIKLDAANAWDVAARTMDPAGLEREVGKADALSAKSGRTALDVRRALGLSTGEQAADIRV
ncbi:DUF4190 domain-containing protein [Kitasatospora purpeofusca]|uniref:DUF4190 domain-containing protein n=1 Tax=Kitasatospora purpeofusca TaxID=67352 RepID=UPI002A5985ED|nr:DUF4190 domain-containing protein [Kitasatospora purpeofusca]MDY0813403.1 DUF4190 domain-containing protein [Kitasatospora purpeofusca]